MLIHSPYKLRFPEIAWGLEPLSYVIFRFSVSLVWLRFKPNEAMKTKTYQKPKLYVIPNRIRMSYYAWSSTLSLEQVQCKYVQRRHHMPENASELNVASLTKVLLQTFDHSSSVATKSKFGDRLASPQPTAQRADSWWAPKAPCMSPVSAKFAFNWLRSIHGMFKGFWSNNPIYSKMVFDVGILN